MTNEAREERAGLMAARDLERQGQRKEGRSLLKTWVAHV